MLLQARSIGQRQWAGTHLYPPFGRVGRDLRQIGEGGDPLACFAKQQMASGAHAWPVVLTLEGNCRRYAEVRRWVVRSRALLVIEEQ